MSVQRQTSLVHSGTQGRSLTEEGRRWVAGSKGRAGVSPARVAGPESRILFCVQQEAGGRWTSCRMGFFLQSARAQRLLSEQLGARLVGVGQMVSGRIFFPFPGVDFFSLR